MKKFLVVLLCAIMVFRISATPAFASSAQVIEVEPLSAVTTSAVAGAFTVSSAGGAMGVGSASLLNPTVAIIALLLATGVYIYNVTGLADTVTEMWHKFSEAAKEELRQIVENGLEFFTLSDYPNLAAEFPDVFEETFYTDDGFFIDSGITFDPSNMLVYDFGAQYVFGDDLTSSIYNVDLGSTPVPIDGTSLSVSLVDSPFTGFVGTPLNVHKCFKFTNSVTGASLTFMPTYTSSWLECDHHSYKISAPVVQDVSLNNGLSTRCLGFWVLADCSHIAGSGVCSSHFSYRYYSQFFGENLSWGDGYYLFENTGIDGLDDVMFNAQYVDRDTGVFSLRLAVSMDGVSTVSLPSSALTAIVSDLTYSQVLVDGAAIPDDDTLVYIPPAAALSDANTLTQAGALTGEWSETLTENPAVPDVETGLFESIVDGIKSAFLSLFIPPDGFFDGFIADITALFEDRMGVLTYPVSVLYDFFAHLLSVGEMEPVLTWPSWSYEGVEVIQAGSFNFNDILENETMKTVHDIYLLLVDVSIVFGLLALLRKKYDSIISN